MKYEGRVYGKINGKYIELEVEKDEIVKTPKRKPLSDGTLPMTDGELEELRRFTGIGMETVVLVEYVPNQFIWVTYSSGREETLDNVEAILYLAERFDLIKED